MRMLRLVLTSLPLAVWHAVLCGAVGHDWSWVRAAQVGESYPVCRRCQTRRGA